MGFEDLKKIVDYSYKERSQKEDEAVERIWRGFRNDVERLTSHVYCEFRKVLDEIGPVSGIDPDHKGYDSEDERPLATITGFKVSYKSESGEFKIKIIQFKNEKGEDMIHKSAGKYWCDECPHNYLDPITGVFDSDLDQRIIDFKTKYNIFLIKNPSNSCDHK